MNRSLRPSRFDLSFARRRKAFVTRAGARVRALACVLGAAVWLSQASDVQALGTWTALTIPFPEDVSKSGVQQPTLMLDGSVIVAAGAKNMHWYKLTPDSTGSYLHGTWSQIASSHVWRSAYASQVMADGRLWVYGGEFATPNLVQNANSCQGEIYDPVANTWTVIPSPPGHDCTLTSPGDAPSVVLPSGLILTQVGLVGNVSSDPVHATASVVDLYSPSTNTWIPGVTPSAGTPNLEEAALTILQDGTVFTMDAGNDGQTCYRYDSTIASGNPWLPCARSPSQLGGGHNGSEEIGPQILLYTGQVLVLGDKTPGASTANIGLYTPPPASNRMGAGTWATNLPPIPSGLAFADLGACVMPNGKVLIEGRRTGDSYFSFWEYDPAANTFTKANPTPTFPETATMVVLPTGQILVINGPSSNALWLYTPDGSPNPAWKPSIAGPIIGPDASGLYTLTGTQLAGLTTGGSLGDDAQTDSNYPILRLTPKGETSPVHYLRVTLLGDRTPAPGKTTSVKFVVPSAVPDGDYALQVVTNGIASDPLGQGAPFHWAVPVGGPDAAVDAPSEVGDATVSPDGGDASSGHDAPDAVVIVDVAVERDDPSEVNPSDGASDAVIVDAAPKEGRASDGSPSHDASDAAVFADAGSGREKATGVGCGCSVQSGRPRNPSGPIWGTLLAGLALVLRRAGRRR